MIIAIVNNKGGTGKTTTCVNLGAGLAEIGKKTLIVDLDAQASASLSLGIPWMALPPSSADMLIHGRNAKTVVRESQIPGLSLITADMDLAGTDVMLADLPDRELQLKFALDGIRSEFDVVLLDCPPSLSLLAVNAMMAADVYLIPITPEYLALEGLISFMDAVDRMTGGLGMHASLMGILFTMVQPGLKTTRKIIQLIRDRYGSQVFKTEIKRDVKISEAPSFSRSVLDFAPKSNGAQAYRKLIHEVLTRCDLSG
jgi:chromosome partitioning protein